MAYQYGKGMAAEAYLRGKDMILGPAINIQRLPTGGRTYEYLSEDPVLSSARAVGYTLGAQDNGRAVCLKHYAVNSQENMRGFVNAVVSERALREIYLPPFEAAVKEANAYGVMAAYNKVGGDWCSENDRLLNKAVSNNNLWLIGAESVFNRAGVYVCQWDLIDKNVTPSVVTGKLRIVVVAVEDGEF